MTDHATGTNPKPALIIIILIGIVFHANAQEWKDESDNGTVLVQSRPVPGLELREFRAETLVSAELETVVAVFRDTKAYPDWFGLCKDMQELEEISEDHRIYRIVLETPFLVRKRDAGGKLPASVVQPYLGRHPLETLTNLHAQVLKVR